MRCFADRSLTFASDLLSLLRRTVPPQITRLYFNLSFLYVRAKVQPDCWRTDSQLSDERQIGYENSIGCTFCRSHARARWSSPHNPLPLRLQASRFKSDGGGCELEQPARHQSPMGRCFTSVGQAVCPLPYPFIICLHFLSHPIGALALSNGIPWPSCTDFHGMYSVA